tara:strand:- start:64 stop:231 length:168 start_codon:yes stop_codon:yes gene_type:complete
MNKDDKIDKMVDDWIDNADRQSLRDYAASKLIEYYQSISEDKFDEYYEDFINENL